jgi:hypothetical protein
VLTGLADENLGWFALNDVPSDQGKEVRRIIKDDLVEDAQRNSRQLCRNVQSYGASSYCKVLCRALIIR